jgi:IclR family acetate operon transcriptional repressor
MTVPAHSDVKSAARVMQIFQLFAELRQPASLAVVSQRLGMPKSSCLALLKTLEANGYVYLLNDARDYYPTRRIFKEAQAIADNDPFLSFVRPILQSLCVSTRETAFLARRSAELAHYVEVLESGQALRFAATVGEKRPLYIGAAGLSLLGAMEENERDGLIGRLAFEKFSDQTVADAHDLAQRVEEGLARGWFMSIDGYQAGVSSIGQFVMLNGEPFAVVVAAPTQRMRENEDGIVKAVLEACRALSRTSIAS